MRELSYKWRDRSEIPLYSHIDRGLSKEMRKNVSDLNNGGMGRWPEDDPDGEPPGEIFALIAALLRRLDNIRLLDILQNVKSTISGTCWML